MKLDFNVCDSLLVGAKRLAGILDYELGSGIKVSAVKGERLGVSLKNGEAVIYYREKNQFFRELGVLVENAKNTDSFDISEDSFFTMTGVMMDTSNYHVITVDGMKRFLDYLAVMGYNMAMLYTEDTIALDEYKYFGYLRGRYSEAELREIDDYAFEYGIEMIPCLECYGHMEKYLVWGEAAPIKDTSSILLAREEKTFEFIEALIKKVSSCLRSKRIHIGMDEAHGMGSGKFLEKHGVVDKNVIFDEFMERLCAITDKYGLTPMMWSDMYFRNNSERNWYYDVNVEIPESTKKRIPKSVELVFWHYGEEPKCDEIMLKKHQELGRNVIFAAGTWCWAGHFPECNYAYETAKFSLEACRKNNVREAMTTIWSKGDSDWFSNLLTLSFTAELCYDANADMNKLRKRFEATTGGDFDAFWDMSLYHNSFDDQSEYDGGHNYHKRFVGQALYWQDILSGMYDSLLAERPMSAHYKSALKKYSAYSGGRWHYLYSHVRLTLEYLAVKVEIAEKLHPAYQSGDKETLKHIADTLLPALIDVAERAHQSHRQVWFRDNKTSNFAAIDIKYGGVKERAKTAIMLLNGYLEGELKTIEELDEVRLSKNVSGFMTYRRIATPTQLI